MARRYIKRQEELESQPHTEDELVGGDTTIEINLHHEEHPAP